MPTRKQKKRNPAKADAGLEFNHAMVYVREFPPALHFYADLLGFKVIEQHEYAGSPVYARLRSPRGQNTLALHKLEPGQTLSGAGEVRLLLRSEEPGRGVQEIGDSGRPILSTAEDNAVGLGSMPTLPTQTDTR